MEEKQSEVEKYLSTKIVSDYQMGWENSNSILTITGNFGALLFTTLQGINEIIPIMAHSVDNYKDKADEKKIIHKHSIYLKNE